MLLKNLYLFENLKLTNYLTNGIFDEAVLIRTPFYYLHSLIILTHLEIHIFLFFFPLEVCHTHNRSGTVFSWKNNNICISSSLILLGEIFSLCFIHFYFFNFLSYITHHWHQGKKIDATPLAMYNFFIERVKANLHIVLAMSPIGDAFRNRLRMFPSLINCCLLYTSDAATILLV